jgi:hypothetical protein
MIATKRLATSLNTVFITAPYSEQTWRCAVTMPSKIATFLSINSFDTTLPHFVVKSALAGERGAGAAHVN